MSLSESDRRALQRAAELAARGVGEVEPNPPVGAVLYCGERILAEGFHRAYGEPHAEVEALTAAPPLPAEAALAVTLEPCSSTGKTPPCTEALLRSGVRKVVVGEIDPDPRHRGHGVQQLRAAGCEVEVAPAGWVPDGLLAEFKVHLQRSRPYVLLKWAAGLDGRWAPASSAERWISGPEARAQVHRLRGHVDGVAVGSGTACADDPLLTARAGGPLRPCRVVLDGRARLPVESQLVRTAAQAPVLWITREGGGRELPGVQRLECGDPHDLGNVLAGLRQRGLHRLLVEGGPRVAAAFLRARVVDRAWVFVAARVFGGSDSGGPALGLPGALVDDDQCPRVEGVERVGCDAWFKLSWFAS